jgi:3-hydroxyacyl-CoA dehydrogenase
VDKAIENGFAMGAVSAWRFWQRHRLKRSRARHFRKARQKYSKTAGSVGVVQCFGKRSALVADYVAGKRDAIPNAEVVRMVDEHRQSLGITPRKISTKTKGWCIANNEAAQYPEEGIASKAATSTWYLMGYGFLILLQGLMLYADQIGLSLTWCRR